MSPTPAAYEICDGAGYWACVRTINEAIRDKEANPQRTVQAMVRWADCGRAMRDLRDELAAATAGLAEAETIIAAMADELALLRQRGP